VISSHSVIALDLGRTTGSCSGTGYAEFVVDESGVSFRRSGVLTVSQQDGDSSSGEMLCRFANDVIRLADERAGNSTTVVWEHALGANSAYIAQHGELRAAVMMALCEDLHVSLDSIPTGTWKKHFVGNGRASKAQVFAAALHLYPTSKLMTQDECDAIGIGVGWIKREGLWREKPC
jgi:Holliday junction resolvasome RuvABC endonuclease subunit